MIGRQLSPRRRRVTAAAFHEAGHAVAAIVLGDEVLEARINIDARAHTDLDGHVTRRNPLHAPSERLRLSNDVADFAEYGKAWEISLIVAVAGPLAQRRHNPRSVRAHQLVGDDADIEELLSDIQPSEREPYRQWATGMAGKIVGECWPAIEAVAAGLLERGGVLTADELKRIVDAEAGNVVVKRD